MGNIADYARWRGDLSFTKDPLNEVDDIIFGMLAHVEFDKALNYIGRDSIKLNELNRVCEKIGYGKNPKELYMGEKSALDILNMIADTKRFGNVLVTNHVNHIDQINMIQFSATEFQLTPDTSYIAYRGTDDSIAGWKEDFIIATGEMTASYEAANYLNQYEDTTKTLYVGGHSKGGHLAVYAAVKAKPNIKSHIHTVFSNDGPGFHESFFELPELADIKDKIISIVPRESFVGMLMSNVAEHQVVQSDKHGLLQHNAIYWKIEGNKLIRSKSLSSRSSKIHKAMLSWVGGMNEEEKRSFINDLFMVLDASGYKTVIDIEENVLKSIPAMTKAINNLTPETKKQVGDVIKYLLKVELQIR